MQKRSFFFPVLSELFECERAHYVKLVVRCSSNDEGKQKILTFDVLHPGQERNTNTVVRNIEALSKISK